jgi:hypothetical protein
MMLPLLISILLSSMPLPADTGAVTLSLDLLALKDLCMLNPA